jgi:hypothetical protein
MFKDSMGINDPRRVTKIRRHYVNYDYFCNTFLPDLEYCESERQIDWVYNVRVGRMFDDEIEEGLDLEVYYVEKEGLNGGTWDTICWKCNEYSKTWGETDYNTSSIFALMLCDLCDGYESE